MADRVAGKAKRAKKASPRPAREAASARATRSPSGGLEAECERLKSELEAAEARIAALEAQRKQLLDRLDWAIDSLQSLREAKD